jgi:hypothetical protein
LCTPCWQQCRACGLVLHLCLMMCAPCVGWGLRGLFVCTAFSVIPCWGPFHSVVFWFGSCNLSRMLVTWYFVSPLVRFWVTLLYSLSWW